MAERNELSRGTMRISTFIQTVQTTCRHDLWTLRFQHPMLNRPSKSFSLYLAPAAHSPLGTIPPAETISTIQTWMKLNDDLTPLLGYICTARWDIPTYIRLWLNIELIQRFYLYTGLLRSFLQVDLREPSHSNHGHVCHIPDISARGHLLPSPLLLHPCLLLWSEYQSYSCTWLRRWRLGHTSIKYSSLKKLLTFLTIEAFYLNWTMVHF